MKKINLVIDIGNTHIVVGIYTEGNLFHSWRLRTDKESTEDEYFAILRILFSEEKISFNDFNICALASVVPALTQVFAHLIVKYFGCKIEIITGNSNLGLTFPMANPNYIGADLIVNAFAAWKKYKTNCLICDFGTATTIQLVGADGYFYGVSISPGVRTSANSLFNIASLLSNIGLQTPDKILGTNTKSALQSGIVLGNAFMVDGIIKKIRQDYKHLEDIKTIATGGIAKLICESTKEIEIVDKTLTLDGLQLICERLK